MRRLAAFLFVLCLAVSGGQTYAFAEKRVAFVIGNGAYRHASVLPNPKNDANDVSSALKRMGFEVVLGIDMDQHQMRESAIQFARAARDADVAMIYYSGHAIQFNGINYLIPVDSRLRDEADIRRMIRVDEMVADLQQAKNLRIMVLDACRDNPLAESLKRSIGRTRAAAVRDGLAKINSPEGMIVAFSTQAGQVAEDGFGRNSPYTTAFLKHIEAKAEIGTVFRRMSADVYAATKQKQLPELSLSLIGEFYLRGMPEAGVVQAPLPPPDPAAVAWETVKESIDPQLVQDYLKQFPQGIFAALARSKLRSLTEQKVAGVFPVPPKLSVDKVKPGEEMQDCDQCPKLVVVPAGTFTMGSAAGERGHDKSEGPKRQVAIARPFAVSKFEITFDEWEACALEGGCNAHKPKDSGWGQGRRPVIHVSWDDAKAYIEWLRQKTGKPYRLLSEAEWEYAARGGTTGAFATGAAITTLQANYDASTVTGQRSDAAYRGKSIEVGTFTANPYGLHDMHGNVMEWVEDCWNPDHNGAPGDGSPRGGDCKRRVLKGGAWYYEADYLRSAARQSYPAKTRLNVVGFRVARTLQ
ncbi:MAG: SUMF1/EgtB/PvdO family nonheme iron enzyme [Hyphomicrobiaceae bacterium]|nr:SUMF1/EgtB/PvdO family nonheme iron enzyme [Hyphomicrobiaceae bacterium]